MNAPKKPTGREIAEEFLKPGYLERARHRATRRQSPWNLLLLPAVIASMGVVCALIVWVADFYLRFQNSQSLFSQETPEWKQALVICGALLVSLPVGMILGNLLVWLIPPARRALDQEAAGHVGTDHRTSQRYLLYLSKKMIALYKKILGQL